MSSRWHRHFLATTCVALSSVCAFAYDIIREGQTIIKWPAGSVPVTLKLGSTATLQDGSNYNSSVQAAMTTWNSRIGSIQFAPTVGSTGTGGDRNGISEIFFDRTIYGTAFGSSTIAITTSYRSGSAGSDGFYARTQSDIIFNSNRTWDSYRGTRQSSLDIRRVALHELGHMLGLDHPDEVGQAFAAIMNSSVSDVDALQTDDLDGASFLYGTNGTITRPANNNFAGATTVTLINNSASVASSSVNADKETNEPNHAPSESGGASVWWKWTATGPGTLAVNTVGSNFDTLLGAYAGSSLANLTQLAANDDTITPAQDPSATRPRTSSVSIAVNAGTTYYLAVDGWQGEWGSTVLNFTFTPTLTAAPTITAQPQNVTVTAGNSASFTVTASGTPTPTYQWSKGGTAISGATSATLTLTNVQASDAGSYSVVVTNSAGSATSNTATLTVNAAVVTTPTTPATSSGGGGGGGAPSGWFFGLLACAAGLRAWQRRRAGR